jgi:hypothetical protein
MRIELTLLKDKLNTALMDYATTEIVRRGGNVQPDDFEPTIELTCAQTDDGSILVIATARLPNGHEIRVSDTIPAGTFGPEIQPPASQRLN